MTESMSPRSNESLKKIYNEQYSQDIYAKFFTFNQLSMFREMVASLPSWTGLDVLDIGSGQGEIAAMAKLSGAAHVVGVDYSEQAVKIAQQRFNIEGLEFIHADFREHTGQYDVVIMCGVLEHFDQPWEGLDYIRKHLLKKGGKIITSSPSFLNPRGFVWMTLQTLFEVPMSLTDLHFLCPFDFEEYCEKNSLTLNYRSIYQNLGWGKDTVADFNKRLRNALRDKGMDNSKVDNFLKWFDKTTAYAQFNDASGALIIYTIHT